MSHVWFENADFSESGTGSAGLGSATPQVSSAGESVNDPQHLDPLRGILLLLEAELGNLENKMDWNKYDPSHSLSAVLQLSIAEENYHHSKTAHRHSGLLHEEESKDIF